MPDEPVSPWARGYFEEQSRLGKEYGSRPRGALRPPRPARGVPDAITNALLGIQAGIQGSQGVNQLGSPLLSALAGASAAASAPRAQDIQAQREAALAQARVQALDAIPVDEVSPGLVERFPELQGLPLGAVNKLAPMLQRQEQLEQTLAMLAIREQGADRRTGARREGIEDERTYRRQERRASERTRLVDRFNADASVKKAQQSIDAANIIRELANSQNPIAAAAIPTFMARASGEVGALSEEDKAPFGGSRSIIERLQAVAQQSASGKLTAENAGFIRQLAGIMEQRAGSNMDSLARLRSRQYGKASDFLGEDDIYSTLRPESLSPRGGVLDRAALLDAVRAEKTRRAGGQNARP